MKSILRLILVALLTVAAGALAAGGARTLPQSEEKPAAEKPVRTDLYGDPLPEGRLQG